MDVEAEYQSRMDKLSIRERVERSQAMFNLTREFLGRQIREEQGEISDERLKWEVAKRMYAEEPVVLRLIARKLVDVSD